MDLSLKGVHINPEHLQVFFLFSLKNDLLKILIPRPLPLNGFKI